MIAPLRSPVIEAKAKEVLTEEKIYRTIVTDDAMMRHIAKIILHIKNGIPLPFHAYRMNHLTTDDPLLDREGIMHLHLGKRTSSELLYVVQWPDHVGILEIGEHDFGGDPPGFKIAGRNATRFAQFQSQVNAQTLLPPKVVGSLKGSLLPRTRPPIK